MKRLILLAAMVLLPSLVFAQATLTGTVKDDSGAVLPGVTVEASSPALIEKTRSAASDGTGQYRIIDLPPGIYSVSFTLSGFTTVKRDGIQLTGSSTITIPVEMKVGGVSETITVTGETPVVDVQSAQKETVLSSSTVQQIPATRAAGALLNATPGINVGDTTACVVADDDLFNARSSTINANRSAAKDGMPSTDSRRRQRSGGFASVVATRPSRRNAIAAGGPRERHRRPGHEHFRNQVQ